MQLAGRPLAVTTEVKGHPSTLTLLLVEPSMHAYRLMCVHAPALLHTPPDGCSHILQAWSCLRPCMTRHAHSIASRCTACVRTRTKALRPALTQNSTGVKQLAPQLQVGMPCTTVAARTDACPRACAGKPQLKPIPPRSEDPQAPPQFCMTQQLALAHLWHKEPK